MFETNVFYIVLAAAAVGLVLLVTGIVLLADYKKQSRTVRRVLQKMPHVAPPVPVRPGRGFEAAAPARVSAPVSAPAAPARVFAPAAPAAPAAPVSAPAPMSSPAPMQGVSTISSIFGKPAPAPAPVAPAPAPMPAPVAEKPAEPSPIAAPAPAPISPAPAAGSPEESLILLKSYELLLTLTDGIKKISTARTEAARRDKIEELSAALSAVDVKNEWENYKGLLNKTNPRFAAELKRRALEEPTPYEERICAMLALGVSTKEIAEISGKSVRTVETAVYKIRKKLDMPADAKTAEWLKQLL